jgi:hypothetical protein
MLEDWSPTFLHVGDARYFARHMWFDTCQIAYRCHVEQATQETINDPGCLLPRSQVCWPDEAIFNNEL